MTKVVIPNYRFSNWSRGQSKPGSWKFLFEFEGKDIPNDISLTQKARDNYAKKKDPVFGYVNFRGLSEKDIISIISSAKRGEVHLGCTRMNWLSCYKIKDPKFYGDQCND